MLVLSDEKPQPNMSLAVYLVFTFSILHTVCMYVIHLFPSILFKWNNICSLPNLTYTQIGRNWLFFNMMISTVKMMFIRLTECKIGM